MFDVLLIVLGGAAIWQPRTLWLTIPFLAAMTCLDGTWGFGLTTWRRMD